MMHEEAWLGNIHLFRSLRASGKIMNEYEVKFYEAACELMEQHARYIKLVLEQSIKEAEERIKNGKPDRDSESSTLGVP